LKVKKKPGFVKLRFFLHTRTKAAYGSKSARNLADFVKKKKNWPGRNKEKQKRLDVRNAMDTVSAPAEVGLLFF
jgi:hypothetical protein